MYDMAVGNEITSVYSGPADPEAYDLSFPPPAEKTHKITYSDSDIKLQIIYREIRNIREDNCSFSLLPILWEQLKKDYPQDWLGALEILELLQKKNIINDLHKEIHQFLEKKKNESDELYKLISDGIMILNS